MEGAQEFKVFIKVLEGEESGNVAKEEEPGGMGEDGFGFFHFYSLGAFKIGKGVVVEEEEDDDFYKRKNDSEYRDEEDKSALQSKAT